MLAGLDDLTHRLLDDRERALAVANDRLSLRDEMLAMIARDLRGPVELIVASAEQLLRVASMPAQRQHLDQIVRSVQRAQRLIRNLAELDGNVTIHVRPVDVVHVVLSAIEAQQVLASDAAVVLQTQLAPAVPLGLADEARLQEAIEHLLVHAIDHGRDGSKVTVDVRGDAGWIHISVHHEHASRRRAFGLEICRIIVEAHGGGLWTSPTPNGVKITCTVPVAAVPEAID